QHHVPVDDLNRLNLDRPPRAGTLLLTSLAFDERAEVPPSVGLPGADDAWTHQPDAADDDARLKQLADAVAQSDFIDLDERLTVAREADVAELEAAKQRSAEAAYFERRREVLIGLPDDELADLILGPAGFDGRQRDAEENENGYDESDDDP